MTAAQLSELRAAFAAAQAISDDRGYQYYAGIHGLPLPAWCDVYGHGKPTFLHWHRAYLWRFELALRATGHDVSLPWWDWLTTPAIPDAYAAARTPDGQPNPLHSVAINSAAIEEGLRGEGDSAAARLARHPQTFRQPGRPGTQLPTRADIDRVLAYDDFPSFTDTLEQWHGAVHMWVGGHMTDIPFAAYDPIFWAHHAMIDRVWWIWQQRHHGASMPAQLAATVMQPFNKSAGDTLDAGALGYDYAVTTTAVPVPA